LPWVFFLWGADKPRYPSFTTDAACGPQESTLARICEEAFPEALSGGSPNPDGKTFVGATQAATEWENVGYMSTLRLPFTTLSPDPYKHLLAADARLHHSALGSSFVELLYFRVSQINGCAFCLEMHGKSLRASGETAERLDQVAGWEVSSAFSDRERAALAWVDAVTRIAETHAPDPVYEGLLEHFTEVEISDMTFAIALMNAFNRLGISMRQ
jgi:AhpD family alkylhydroperoxidase